jgi:uncharacterized protein YecE (DUF72 family)
MSLFPSFEDDPPAQAARLAPKLQALAERGVYFGTSSWKYEGWLSTIYSPERYTTRGKVSKKKFEETCLAEYARTFPTVCGDFAFYQFPTAAYWAKLFGETPASFLIGLKVPEDLTVATWPTHSRYANRAGLENNGFLDAGLFRELFAKPLEPYADRLGPLIFEFGTFNKKTFPLPADFYASLDAFLGALPPGFLYGVEIRNPEYLSPEYFGLLSARNVAHVFNAWTRMPTLDMQIQLPDAYAADFTVVRALLAKGRPYEQAVQAFAPYRLIKEPNEGARDAMTQIAQHDLQKRRRAFLFVNNRLEGHAPTTIESVIDRLAL